MNKFVRNLLTEWRKLGLPFAGKVYLVAVSGGADSVALALGLSDLQKRKKMSLRFVIAHFNHNLRGAESEKDAEFVEELAGKSGLEFIGATAGSRYKILKKGNLEQNARLARYEFLLATAENLHADGILTAHTVNDQAETFLLNLIRGSGIVGLSGMKALNAKFTIHHSKLAEKSQIAKPKSQIALVRPLLNWARREDTEKFCAEQEIVSRYDAMNDDLNFRRVRVRKILLPALKEFNPKIIETLAATAKLLHTQSSPEFDAENTKFKDYLILKDMKCFSQAMLYNVLRDWLGVNRGSLRQIELKHIAAIERLISSRKSGRLVELPNGETVIKQGGKLFWQEKNVENNE